MGMPDAARSTVRQHGVAHQLGDQRQAIALVARGRQVHAAVEEILGVGGGIAVLVDDPALGQALALGAVDRDLAVGDGSGGEVDDHRAEASAGHGEGVRVGGEQRLGAAEGRRRAPEAVHATAEHDAEHAGRGHRLGEPHERSFGPPL